ncbi:snare-domain-containing protein [Coccomyxa subellipsoidea C-169]|uniref:Snare-domain-containing protein n=1 Tax=Coccomyxa subellipsoidea (strain C-169) TaxID=574566 RepID=I0YT90_COCSC|nr:snare-domain-containing protein [Coccomyxa subellipsoidea C-169]EIE21609.1 snare-domain-containing protein [Coccomyxa subellipsoidea C-169]|eukprot:XP_005646153.1 snare-domain-containing protein [Coccomyxa subellipsoidea C-169]
MSFQDIAQSGSTRELRQYGGAPESQADKANKDLIARVFRLQTEVSRLRSDVNKLGGPRDTVDLRHKVGSTTVRLQEDAKSIKEALTVAHSEHKSRQTTKILSDFEEQKRLELGEMDTQIQYNEALIDERDQGIAEISQQIGEVNEIFQDLAVLVNDQGLMLDDIESNIERTADRTRAAGSELVRAERYQRSSRNKMCLILLIVAFVLAVIVLVTTL